MAYTTDKDVRYYIDAQGTAGIGTEVIGTYAMGLHIEWSQAIVDMKLSKRYSVPFTTVPPAVKAMTTTLSAWKSLRSIYSGEIPSALQFIAEDYKQANDLLDLVSLGSLELPAGTVAGGGLVTELGHATKYWSSTMGYTPTFDVDDETNWAVDADRLSDIADNRE